MKRSISLIIMIVFLSVLVGCDNEQTDNIKIPFSSGVCKGENYQDVINDLEDAGFTNIEFEVLSDLKIGWLTKDGEVEQVSVNGDPKYNPDSRYPKDVKIVITYHTFPEKNQPDEINSTSSEEVILTVKNNNDLKAVLETNGEIDQIYSEFAEKYKGQIIELNGHIDYVANHENYKTRWDILLSFGDWVDEQTVSSGPVFKFEDVGLSSMGIKDLYLPSFIKISSNVHIVAEIMNYDMDKGIFFLKPISLESR